VSYFSQKEFQAFLATEVGRINCGWLALSGKVLSAAEVRELEQFLAEFFRRTGHLSFKKHGAPVK
jgi:hypothetical protein